METKIINLVGASGSGKTSIVRELEKQGHNVIQSYTTRAARHEGEWGHIFISDWFPVEVQGTFVGVENDEIATNDSSNKHKYIDIDDMIAYFNSYNSGNHYFATDDQVVRGKTNIYIVDPEGAKMVHEFYKGSNVEVKTVYLEVDEQIRAERLVRRVNNGYCITPKDNPDVWERIRPDRKLFRIVECDYTINGNRSLEKVLETVEKII